MSKIYIVVHIAMDDHGDVDAVAEPVVRRVIPCTSAEGVAAAIKRADVDGGENWSIFELVGDKAIQRAIVNAQSNPTIVSS
jgi:hypothetical protein